MDQNRTLQVWIFGLAICMGMGIANLGADNRYSYAPNPGLDRYFGHISYVEIQNDGKDPVVFREGGTSPDLAVLNYPIGPGDIIQTTPERRCEIQFDTGTIIRLEKNSQLRIETMMAQSLSAPSKITNFRLDKGWAYIMFKRYNKPEIFQVKTSNTAIKLNHNTTALINAADTGATHLILSEGKAEVLYGSDQQNIHTARVKKSQSMTITSDHRQLKFIGERNSEFLLWNEDLNQNFAQLHTGISKVPKPILRYPEAVIHFAKKYSHRYGEWIWDGLHGFVWRPSDNDRDPHGAWQPYFYGQWIEKEGEMFWVPRERWGWVPHHLGLWTWDKNKGWLWIPGSAFSPAWVDWSYTSGYSTLNWRPLLIQDWMDFAIKFDYSNLFTDEVGLPWGWLSCVTGFSGMNYTGYLGYYFYSLWMDRRAEGQKNYRCSDGYGLWVYFPPRMEKVKIDSGPLYDLPKELKKVVKKVEDAVKDGDSRMVENILYTPRLRTSVKPADFASPRIDQHILTRDELISGFSSRDVEVSSHPAAGKRVASILRESRNEALGRGIEKSRISEEVSDNRRFFSGGNIGPDSANMADYGALRKNSSRVSRIQMLRDWNPDIQVAGRAGLSIVYDSRGNEVVCPELNMRSSSVDVRSFRSGGAAFGMENLTDRMKSLTSQNNSGYSSSSSQNSSLTAGRNSSSARENAGESRSSSKSKKEKKDTQS